MIRLREKRTSVLYVRLTKSELKKIRARAKRAGKQLSEFVRQKIV